ncbi:MAG TPA: methyltransferase domain-containing protein [Caulobacteraceae bacterium]|nr:methyltransferase domain-containing protein [Caulobacteraceae bacterium]
MPVPPRLFDRDLHRKRLDRAAAAFAEAGFLKRRAAADLVERLETILRNFPRAVDLGARDGAFAQALARSPAHERIGFLIETDLSTAMLGGRATPRVRMDEERLAFADQSLDLIVSSLALHWVNDLPGCLIQIRRALRPEGLFMAALLGGETLFELRTALMQAEAESLGGAAARVSPAVDAREALGLLQRAGFQFPVTDVDRVKVRYAHPLNLLGEIRAMGETSAFADRRGPSLTRHTLARASEIYAQQFADEDGRIAATFDIVTLTGWAPV